jgi:hypothetical protein
MASLKVKIPIKTISEANTHEHWTKSSKRHKNQKQVVKVYLNPYFNDPKYADTLGLPCQITLTRLAPRSLDDDENLPMAFKWIKDAICELLVPGKAIGQADNDKRIQTKYAQMKGLPKEYAIQVEIIKNVV